ncbi:MAG: hypothetical protein LBE56_12435 [Tannerella sp.]|jgi:hypothetical protein|nr:hypothetical protein [Tannerella sp.]
MDRYVNMRPRVVQYNRLTNPSRCHFGIIGSSYNINNSKPLSLVDLAKPYNYLYDVIHDRLNRNLAASWGVKAAMDFSLIPDKWDIDKWLYFTKTTPFYPKDSFKEGNKGAATGKLAGMMNSSATTLNLDQSAIISQDIQLLNFIKAEMGEVMGITPQREGAISSSETVGGVERSVIQSNSITEWLFTLHDNIKKRVCECFLETAKVAFRGRSIKLPYILHSGYQQMLEFDGDEFAECDYGLVVDNTNDVQSFLQKLEMYAHALIQNKQITTGTLAKIWNKASINDIVRSIEYDERKTEESNLQSMRMQQEQFKAELERKAVMDERLMQLEELKLQDNREANIRDNETRKEIADKQVELKRDLQALIESDKTDFEVDQLIRQRLKL